MANNNNVLIKIKNVIRLVAEYINADNIDDESDLLLYTYKGHFISIATKILTVLGWIDFSKRNGKSLYVYISDMDSNLYGNEWEMFCKQPMVDVEVSKEYVDSTIKGNAILLPSQTRYHYKFYPVLKPLMKIIKPTIVFPSPRDYKNNIKAHNKFKALYKQFINYKIEVEEYMNNEFLTLFNNKDNILGIVCRGTDYVQRKPEGHPVQPNVVDVIDYAIKMKESYPWNYIFLATEEKAIADKFESFFPNRIITNKRCYLDGDYSNKYLCDTVLERENDQYYRDLEYLSSINLLSKCKYLIGGLCGASQMALIMNENPYEHVHLFDLGDYQ